MRAAGDAARTEFASDLNVHVNIPAGTPSPAEGIAAKSAKAARNRQLSRKPADLIRRARRGNRLDAVRHAMAAYHPTGERRQPSLPKFAFMSRWRPEPGDLLKLPAMLVANEEGAE